jgi:uncharacterized protein
LEAVVPVPILLVSSGVVHPSLAARYFLERCLDSMPGYTFQRVASLEAITRFNPAQFRAMVLYYHHKKISPAALQAFESYVRGGGGILALHSAAASFKQEPRYYDVLGGRFTHHGPVEPFQVQPNAADAPGGRPEFGPGAPFSLRDELYRHEYAPDNRVHFWIPLGQEDREPLVWTRSFGEGRVCYCAAGHTASSIKNAGIQSIVRGGLVWAAGGSERAAAQPAANRVEVE